MIYSRLPVLFLGTITSEKYGAANAAIASTILKNLHKAKNYGIQDIADMCNVSVSSISRFCTQIGLSGFAEFREILMNADLSLEQQSFHEEPDERYGEYEDNAVSAIREASRSIDREALNRLVSDIQQYDRIAVFGLLKAQSAAISLASDLMFSGKQVYSNVSFSEQIEYLKSAGRNDLVLIFSYTGSYFEGVERSLNQSPPRARIWMISGGKQHPSFIRNILGFDSKLDQASHPYQLLYMATVIAQEYLYQYRDQ